MSAESAVEERWVFAGVRVNAERKLTNAWVPDPGQPNEALFFAPQRGEHPVVGASYVAKVDRLEGATFLHGVPRFEAANAVDVELRAKWTAADEAARARAAAMRRERSEAKANALDEALEPLLTISASLKTRADRDAFVAAVIRRLWSQW
jgi:hypothetical protein